MIVPADDYLAGLRKSQKFVSENREYFDRAREAVMSKIMANENAAAALSVTKSPMLAASNSSVPDFDKAKAKAKKTKPASAAE